MEEFKLPKHILQKVLKIHKNQEQTRRYAKQVNEYLDSKEMGFDYFEEIESSSIVDGELIEEKGKTYLKVKGQPLAKSNKDGMFCHQVCQFEDSYYGEFYIKIGDGQYLKIDYTC